MSWQRIRRQRPDEIEQDSIKGRYCNNNEMKGEKGRTTRMRMWYQG